MRGAVMARYKQIWNEELGKSEFIEIGVERQTGGSHAVFNDLQPFVSPVDGTVISDRKQLREHNIRNNVVNAHEFDSHWETKRQERDRLYTGQHTAKESLARKQEIYEAINRAEREHG